MDWITVQLLPGFFRLLGSLNIVPGVSFLGFLIAVTLIIIVVGAILIRV